MTADSKARNISRLSALHAAAVALVAWYLMVPPISDRAMVQLDRPLSEWQQDGVFDAASDCQRAKDKEIICDAAIQRGTAEEIDRACEFHAGTKSRTDDVMRLAAHLRIERYTHAQCLATDDPHLAK